MRFLKTALSTALFVTSALCQGIVVNSPAPGTTVTRGSNITVQVGMGDFPENIDNIALAIGLQSCDGSVPCASPLSSLGTPIYEGPWDPSFGPEAYNIYQNFNVTIPESAVAGPGNIAVVGYYLIAASYVPTLVGANATVTIV